MDFIIFGVTGDLAEKKIMPALRDLKRDHELPEDTKIIGFARSRKQIGKDILFIEGDYSIKEDVLHIADILKPDRPAFFYFALPQKIYLPLLLNLFETGIVKKGMTEKRTILLEKPFGIDLESANELQRFLKERFDEHQICRVDHYVGKSEIRDMKGLSEVEIQDIQEIEIVLSEAHSIKGRASFYDEVGTLFDVGQNHMLLILGALINGFEGNRIEVLRALRYVSQGSIFGQYEGFLDEPGVKENSTTETFFSINAQIEMPEWEDRSIRLIAGKALPKSEGYIKILKKDASEEIIILKPGNEAYKNIFRSVANEEKSSFIPYEEIEAAWRFIEQAKADSKSKELIIYPQGVCPRMPDLI